MCLLGWLETEVEVDWRMIELGQFFLFHLLGGEHIYGFCRLFCFIVSMPSTQLSLSSKDTFFLFSHDTYQGKYHLNSSSSSSCVSPGSQT